MTKYISLQALVLVAAVLLLGAASFASANHSWGKYHWDLSTAETTADPLDLVNNLTTANWNASLALASDDWNQSVIKNEIVAGGNNPNCDPSLGNVEVCNGDYGNNGWLGIAQVWAYRGKDGHIAQAVTMLNDYYFNQSAYNTSAWRNLVMCQEVGHTFGLGHQDENFSNPNLGSCMDYTNDPDGSIYGQANNEHPDAHDLAMLEEIYAHVNDTETNGGGGKPDKGDGGPGNGKGGGKNKSTTTLDPAEWGQAVAQDAQGKNSVYVRNLENGMQLTTHVLWTPEEHDEHHDH